ncbi:MAG TPA: TraR/DksA C4-type zinc finger protein [Anaerolineales bacterium]|nr:TraR/DksA C4-type zinc finger protein [Anaerolineales bacterium]
MNTQLDLEAIRVKLEEQRHSLVEQISAEKSKLTPQAAQNPDRSSLAMEYASHELDLALYEKNHYQLSQVNAALKRINEGTYGICERCGNLINPERLEILPYATLCIGCQMKQEVN